MLGEGASIVQKKEKIWSQEVVRLGERWEGGRL